VAVNVIVDDKDSRAELDTLTDPVELVDALAGAVVE